MKQLGFDWVLETIQQVASEMNKLKRQSFFAF